MLKFGIDRMSAQVHMRDAPTVAMERPTRYRRIPAVVIPHLAT
jgi:hypothetical protein